MKRLGIKSAITATAVCCFLGSSYAQIGPDGGGGTSYTAGSGLTLTGSSFKLGDANLTYSAGALATTSLALGGATLGANALAVTGASAFGNITATGPGTGVLTPITATGSPGTGSGNLVQFSLVNATGGTSKVQFNMSNKWAFGSDIGGSNATDFYLYDNGSSNTPLFIGSNKFATVFGLGFSSGGAETAGDAFINRDSAGVLADRNSTNAQALRVADSFTDASDYSWAGIVAGQTGGSEACAANTLCLGSWHLGTPGGGGSLTKFGLYVDGALQLDYNKTTASAWTLANLVMTSAAPTVAAAQIGYGSTVTANTNCGTLTLSAGCIVVNVAGTTRYIPYY